VPGIDYAELRAVVTIAQVLELAGFVASEAAGDQVRGPCRVHGSSSAGSRSFSANLSKNTFRCFKCGTAGNHLDLWMAVTKVPLHEAARDLCARLGVEAPLIRGEGK
jgi:DNA primase